MESKRRLRVINTSCSYSGTQLLSLVTVVLMTNLGLINKPNSICKRTRFCKMDGSISTS